MNDKIKMLENSRQHFRQVKTPTKNRPLGKTSPIVWSIEPAFGCNLQCGHCCADLINKKDNHIMKQDVWKATFNILNEVSPYVRVDLCGFVGEPTLNPNLLNFLQIARKIAPYAQIQITTNGTKIRSGAYTMKDLLDAGANILYIDQYGGHTKFEHLADESGYPWYQYYDAPKDAPTPWRYWSPDQKIIVLMEEPSMWPQSRLKSGLLGNWYGNINWKRGEAQKKFNMRPLLKPLTRRCNQPFLYVTVSSEGDYLLCCQDGLQVTKGKFGNVLDGIKGFKKFWYGKEIQLIRRRLRYKNRADTHYACQKCNITFSRCDFRHWELDKIKKWYDGEKWYNLKDDDNVGRFDRAGEIKDNIFVEQRKLHLYDAKLGMEENITNSEVRS